MVLLARGQEVVGALWPADRLRPHAQNLQTVLLTGDGERAARG
ncbi:hypothetical protein [Ruania zhangjianzhongii]|nr:hypothetical protein [Ruania zhangjianzhongii]